QVELALRIRHDDEVVAGAVAFCEGDLGHATSLRADAGVSPWYDAGAVRFLLPSDVRGSAALKHGGMITAENLTKRFGARTAVDDASFTVKPGKVTGFLGPNGAGKSTTMRMIMGLDRPTSGRTTVNGRTFAEHPDPLH